MNALICKYFSKYLVALTSLLSFLFAASKAHATWTPLITFADFTGLQSDVMTTAGGVISIVLIIIAVSYLVRALSN